MWRRRFQPSPSRGRNYCISHAEWKSFSILIKPLGALFTVKMSFRDKTASVTLKRKVRGRNELTSNLAEKFLSSVN